MPKAQKNHRKEQANTFRGAGMMYALVIFILTLIAILLGSSDALRSGAVPTFQTVSTLIGLLAAAAGLVLWYLANRMYRSSGAMKGKQLLTDGVYGWVRHPMYLALTLVCDGALICGGNLWLLILIPVYHLYLSAIVREEERELAVRFGDAWEQYCKQTHALLLFPPSRRG